VKFPSKSLFASLLLTWHHQENTRKMPWSGITDPYKIWLSEIILQQTRVEQGIKYYDAFTHHYPTVSSLALADDDEVFRLWQGLGYYNRCRNMLETARYLHHSHNGKFPNNYPSILALKGVGTYTAAAISSFAFNLPFAVVDGNVVRVLSRVFGIRESYFETSGKKYISEFAQHLLETTQPGAYNQAIMDFGATICKPQQPLCAQCPFEQICVAHKEDVIDLLPVRKVRKPLKNRYFHFFMFSDPKYIFLIKRQEADIWKDLYTPYAIEAMRISRKQLGFPINNASTIKVDEYQQVLSHQRIHGHFYHIELSNPEQYIDADLIKVDRKHLNKYAFPKLILLHLKKYNYL
jgi:A/G-specific adenine glycosylase